MVRKELYLNGALIEIGWAEGAAIFLNAEWWIYDLPSGNKIKIILVDEKTDREQVFNLTTNR